MSEFLTANNPEHQNSIGGAEVRDIYKDNPELGDYIHGTSKKLSAFEEPVVPEKIIDSSEGRLGSWTVDQILVAGEMYYGVTRLRPEADRDELIVPDKVQVVVLPLGAHEGKEPVAVGSYNLKELAVNDEYTLRIGRSYNPEVTQGDKSLSREHAILRISTEGVVEVEDMSTNGTVVLHAETLYRHESVGGIPERARQTIINNVASSLGSPEKWFPAEDNQKRVSSQAGLAALKGLSSPWR